MERLLPREGLEALCLAIQLETLTQELDADVARHWPRVQSLSNVTQRRIEPLDARLTANARSR